MNEKNFFVKFFSHLGWLLNRQGHINIYLFHQYIEYDLFSRYHSDKM